MTSILLANFHSFYNAGDTALLEISVHQLREAIPGVKIGVIANYPHEDGFSRLGVTAVPSPEAILRYRGRWVDLRRAYSQADALISVPGNPFFSMGRVGWTLAVSASQLWLAQLFRLPYFILAQTIGPFRRKWEVRLMRQMMNKARQIWVREQASLELLQNWGLTRVQYAPDAIFDYPVGELPIKPVSSEFQFGVSVIPAMVRTLPNLDEYYRRIGEGLTGLIRDQQTHITFFGQSCGPTRREDDRQAAHEVLRSMPADVQKNVTIDESIYEPGQLLQRYRMMDGMLAWRLHAGLLATIGGVPTLWLSYLSKTEGMLNMLDWKDNLLSLDQLTSPELYAALMRTLNQQQEIREQRAAQIEGLRLQARRPVEAIAAELNRRRVK
jgi:polysaccharide pyruvyl transferase WcaK-like protein